MSDFEYFFLVLTLIPVRQDYKSERTEKTHELE
jgi:hypothetical protein